MILAMLLALAPAPLPSAEPLHAYRTQLTARYEAFGYTGTLQLRWDARGYVNGYYRADTGGTLVQVGGAFVGKDRLWFNIPTLGGLHVEARLTGTGMTGLASPISGPSSRLYEFTATPVQP